MIVVVVALLMGSFVHRGASPPATLGAGRATRSGGTHPRPPTLPVDGRTDLPATLPVAPLDRRSVSPVAAPAPVSPPAPDRLAGSRRAARGRSISWWPTSSRTR